jgi:hypothetical protein
MIAIASDRDQRLVFYRGLLLALRQERVTFLTEGERFHKAFGLMLDATASAFAEAGLGEMWDLTVDMKADHDPMFGVYKSAEELILQGLVDLLLMLEAPRLILARLNLSAARAAEELEDIPHAAVYRQAARVFDRHLGASK